MVSSWTQELFSPLLPTSAHGFPSRFGQQVHNKTSVLSQASHDNVQSTGQGRWYQKGASSFFLSQEKTSPWHSSCHPISLTSLGLRPSYRPVIDKRKQDAETGLDLSDQFSGSGHMAVQTNSGSCWQVRSGESCCQAENQEDPTERMPAVRQRVAISFPPALLFPDH